MKANIRNSIIIPSALTLWQGLLLLALVLYTVAGAYQRELPGLYYDEALDAVPAMQVVLGQGLDNEAVVHFAGREWPLMVMPYVGTTTTYLLIPGFAWLGVSTFTLRLANWIVGLVTLLLVWGFVRE